MPTGLLLTDICCLDFCWLGLDICWLRHLLISANLPFADSTRTFADPDICWSFLYPPIETFADPDICWFYQKSDLLNFFPAFFTVISGKFCSFSSIFLPYYINVPSIFDQICEFSANFIKNCFKISFSPQNFITKTGFRCSKFIYVEFFIWTLKLTPISFFALCTP